MKETKIKEIGKKIKIKIISLFIIFELGFTIITGPLMIYYGPFKNINSTVVGAVKTTSYK